MNITDFEPDIEEKILTRGEKYFADGMVDELWSESPNRYHAVVEGTTPYDVEIHLDQDGELIYHDCDCPYDWGEYCKHEVAILLAIREHLSKGTVPKSGGRKRGFRALLTTQTKEGLVDLLCELAQEDYGLREEIIYYLTEKDDNNDEWDE